MSRVLKPRLRKVGLMWVCAVPNGAQGLPYDIHSYTDRTPGTAYAGWARGHGLVV